MTHPLGRSLHPAMPQAQSRNMHRYRQQQAGFLTTLTAVLLNCLGERRSSDALVLIMIFEIALTVTSVPDLRNSVPQRRRLALHFTALDGRLNCFRKPASSSSRTPTLFTCNKALPRASARWPSRNTHRLVMFTFSGWKLVALVSFWRPPPVCLEQNTRIA